MYCIYPRRKVRNFLINPKYQLRYVLWTTLIGLVLILVDTLVFYYFTKENYKLLVDMSPMEDNVKLQLYHELHMILGYLSMFSIVFLASTALLGIIISHRTAGPLYRFRQVFLQIQKGDVSARIHLRPKDDFLDVAEECNKAIDFISKKTTRL